MVWMYQKNLRRLRVAFSFPYVPRNTTLDGGSARKSKIAINSKKDDESSDGWNFQNPIHATLRSPMQVFSPCIFVNKMKYDKEKKY